MHMCCCTETQQVAGFIRTPRREKVLEQHAGRQLNQKPTIRNKWLFKGSIIHAFTKDHLLGTNTSFILSAALEKKFARATMVKSED